MDCKVRGYPKKIASYNIPLHDIPLSSIFPIKLLLQQQLSNAMQKILDAKKKRK